MAAPFGDIGLGQNLEAVRQQGRQFFVDVFVNAQDAVATETDAHLILHRLDVDVAGSGVHGIQEQGVDQLDDVGSFVGLNDRRREILRVPLVDFERFANGALAGDQRHQIQSE